MKRFILLLLLLLLLLIVGCTNGQNNTIRDKESVMEYVSFIEREQYSIEWEQISNYLTLDDDIIDRIKPVDTKQSAIGIAECIIDVFHNNGKFLEYTLVSIIHSLKDNMWFFEYSIDQRNVPIEELIDCGNLYVAIDGIEGKIINAWIEE